MVHAALETHWVGSRSDRAQALVHHRLGEHGRGGGAVASDVIGLGGNFLGQLRTEVFERVIKLDLTGDGHTVVGDRGGTPLLVEYDVATLGPQGHLDCIGERVDTALKRATSFFVEFQNLGHVCSSKSYRLGAVVAEATAAPNPQKLNDQEMTASTSRAERMRYSAPAYLTSVPPYLL